MKVHYYSCSVPLTEHDPEGHAPPQSQFSVNTRREDEERPPAKVPFVSAVAGWVTDRGAALLVLYMLSFATYSQAPYILSQRSLTSYPEFHI